MHEAENFAQLKEFVLASCDERPTCCLQPLEAKTKHLVLILNKMISIKVGKCDELLEKNSNNVLVVFQDYFAIIGISVVLIVVEMDTHNVTARRIQTRNVTISVIAREQISH